MMQIILLTLSLLCAIHSACAPQDEESSPVPDAPASEPPATLEPDVVDDNQSTADVSADADALLDRLEQSSADLSSFKANITYREVDPIFDEVTLSFGSIIYVVDADAGTHFGILFANQMKGNEQRPYNEHFLFDGEWLVQKNFDDKSFIKRQIVPPGEEFDPLKLGEGPFPMPIGQAKENVLSRFDVEMAALSTDEGDYLAKMLKDEAVVGLSLVPKPGTPESEDFEKVIVYYDEATLLPAGIDVFRVGGDCEQVLLKGRERNEGVDETLLDTTVPESGWRVDIRPWQGE